MSPPKGKYEPYRGRYTEELWPYVCVICLVGEGVQRLPDYQFGNRNSAPFALPLSVATPSELGLSVGFLFPQVCGHLMI